MPDEMSVSALIVAAGSGKRMQSDGAMDKPKQFWPLGNTVILAHSIEVMIESPVIADVIIVCATEYHEYVRHEILTRYATTKRVELVAGGKERADSVLCGLRVLAESCTHVLIHDGVRPLVTTDLVESLCRDLGTADGIIVARPVVPTLKRVHDQMIVETVDRSSLWEAETPQLFTRRSLEEAYRSYSDSGKAFTDEASLVELNGGTVRVYAHQGLNTKITTLTDYRMVKAVLEGTMIRVGMGYDIHRLVTGRELILGGITIPNSKGCLGHSDGDPLLHAIADALLGAAALGDIGEHFSDTNPKYKDMASSDIVTKVHKMVRQEGFMVHHVDTIVVLERPSLAPYKKAIRKHIAELLDIDITQVSVKAKTNEGLDSEGSGFAVTAHALVTVGPIVT